jgi:hypothetical protein
VNPGPTTSSIPLPPSCDLPPLPADIAPKVMDASDGYWLISKADTEAIALYVNRLKDWITVASGCIEGAK